MVIKILRNPVFKNNNNIDPDLTSANFQGA
jgi:hypothetical protein